jgi:hypothetical protein
VHREVLTVYTVLLLAVVIDTVIVDVAVRPPLVRTVTTAVPLATAVTTPDWLTVATEVLLLDQV